MATRPFEIRCEKCERWHDGNLKACPLCLAPRGENVMARGGGLDVLGKILFARPKGFG